MLIIYFVVQLMGYFKQTDWSGDTSQIQWVDTSSYFDFNLIDGRTTKGNLKLYAPSGIWKTSKQLSIYQVNAIQTGNNGIIYLGCGVDSARVIKLGNYGDSIIFNKVLQYGGNPGQVLSILKLSNENLVVGTERGDIFLVQDTVATWKFQPGYKVQTLCNDGSWVYAAIEGGKIHWSVTNGISWSSGDTSRIPETNRAYSIFKPSNSFLYACTQSLTGQGQIYKSVNNGRNWTIVNTFTGVEAVYSMAEDYEHNLYVSTGYSGKIFTSSDFGTSWQEIPSPWQTADFYSIVCNPMGVVYTAGQCLGMSKAVKGMVFSTKNQGVSWDTVFKYPTGALPTRILAMTQSNEGFMVVGGDTNVCFISGYVDSGWLVSSVYDAFDSLPRINNSLKFINIHYNCNLGDSIKVKVRASKYPDSLGNWGENVPNDSNPTKYGGVKNGDRYIQYKVNLKTNNAYKSPNLSEIYIKYSIDIEEPIIDSVFLSDSFVKWNSYVLIYFNKYIDGFSVNSSNIDSIFRLNNNHSWRSDTGRGIIKAPGEWITPSLLKIPLSTLRIGRGEGYYPTLVLGDTVYPNSSIIKDTLGNPCLQPTIISISVKPAISENNEKLYPELSITPNPFNRLSKISYGVPFKSNVSIKIYDCVGRLSEVLVNEEKEKGIYFMKLENNNLTRGIYFIKFIMNDKIMGTKKVILVSIKK
ncbi:MAG: T9SS type A sorting domain-containing protein [bacterium]|nr:T9SS type A sorting domain-containing protein [bacterium]